jgi:pilus assembly protein CpaB
MSGRTVVVGILALVFGASAAVGVNQLIQQRRLATAGNTVPIVVASSPMVRGSVLSERVVKIEQWPEDMLPAGAITDLRDVQDRTVLTKVFPGEPILEGKLAPTDAGRGLAAMIPYGMRAFTIRTINVAAGVAGFILPGNRVDVLMTTTGTSAGEGSGGGATTTLLQNLEILAVDQRLDAPDENKVDPNQLKSVTLLVTPDQAAKLGLATNRGILQLSLRRPEDHDEADTQPATMAELRFHQGPPVLPIERSPSGWSEIANSFAQGMASMAEASKHAQVSVQKPVTPVVEPLLVQPLPAPPRTAEIVTLRGSHRGKVRIVETRSTTRNLQ